MSYLRRIRDGAVSDNIDHDSANYAALRAARQRDLNGPDPQKVLFVKPAYEDVSYPQKAAASTSFTAATEVAGLQGGHEPVPSGGE